MFAHEDEIKFALVAFLCISSAVAGYCVALATIRVRSSQAWIAVQEKLDGNLHGACKSKSRSIDLPTI